MLPIVDVRPRPGRAGGDVHLAPQPEFVTEIMHSPRFGATLTVSGSAITGNEALGGKRGADGNGEFGGSGFGGGLYTDGPSIYPSNPGTPTTLTVLSTTITQNEANGGGGDETGTHAISAGGGLYIAADRMVCIDMDTSIFANHASGRDDDVFGFFTVCP